MRFHTQKHLYYCGIDLHARSTYLCILDHGGEVVLHRTVRTEPGPFLKAITPYREDLVVAVECIFTWYWLADLCASEGIPAFCRNPAGKCHRVGVAEHFPNLTVRKSIQANLILIELYSQLTREPELYIVRTAKEHDPQAFHLLQTVPGIGTTLALVILYEIHNIKRFPTVGDFASYSRLVKCAKMSAGKRHG